YVTTYTQCGSKRGPDNVEGATSIAEQFPTNPFTLWSFLGELFNSAPQHSRSLADHGLGVRLGSLRGARVLFPDAFRRGVGGFLRVGGGVGERVTGGCAHISLVLFAPVLAEHLTGKAASVLRRV